MEMESSCKRGKAPAGGCVVDGCEADLSVCREYHRRHKVCEAHSKTPKVSIAGREQRFCQQCSRFHSLLEFDDGKRSCRKRLDGHNRRRRKHPHPHPQPPHQNSTTHFDELGGGGTLLVSFNNNNNNNSSFWRIPDHDDNNLLYTTPTTHLHHHQHHNYYTNNNAESSTHISNSSSIFQNDAAALSLLSLEAPPPPPNQLHYSTSATRTFTWDH